MGVQVVPSGSTNDFESLVRELNHPIWEVRRDACEELGLRGEKEAVPFLLRMLQDGVGAVRFAAAESLGKLGDNSVVPSLLEALKNPAFGSFGPLVEALANLKAPEAIPYFIGLLRDKDARVRGLAANALMVLTHQLIPYRAKAKEEEREEAVKQWEAWWQKNKGDYLPQ